MSSKAQTREKDYERGLRIADSRKAIGLSQDELAHRVGIGRQAIDCTPDSLDSRLKRLPADKQDYLEKTFDFMIEQALKSA